MKTRLASIAWAGLMISLGGTLAGCTSPGKLAADRPLPPVPAADPATDLVHVRVFEAPVEEVWRAWTESDMVRQWWGPAGFTCPVAEMDVREGGTSLVAMRAPEAFGGGTYYNTWTYTAVLPPRRLDFIARFTDERGTPLDPAALGLPPGIPAEVPHVLTFDALDEKRTKLTIIEYGYGSPQAIDLSRQGLEQCLDKLSAALQQP